MLSCQIVDHKKEKIFKDGFDQWIRSNFLNYFVIHPTGPITIGQLTRMLPYGDTIDKVDLKGVHLLEVLEHSVAAIGDGKPNGAFLQVSGLWPVVSTLKLWIMSSTVTFKILLWCKLNFWSQHKIWRDWNFQLPLQLSSVEWLNYSSCQNEMLTFCN